MFATGTSSYLLVTLQFLLIFAVIVSGRITPGSPIGWLPLIFSIILGLSGIWYMTVNGKLNIFPDVHPHSSLVSSGPYRYIRHPMYSAILLGCFGLIIADPAPARLVYSALLALLLLTKLHIEETGLKKLIPGYRDYSRHTRRLIPFLW